MTKFIGPISMLSIAALCLTSCENSKTVKESEKIEMVTKTSEDTVVKEIEKELANDEQSDEEKMVIQEAMTFYKSVTDGTFDGAIAYLHPAAIKANPKSDWLKLLEDTKKQFGKLQNIKVLDSKEFIQVKTIVGVANYYQIIFENKYENGTLYELLSFVRENGSDKTMLLNYFYNSDRTKITFEEF
ncbi:MAG: hypothetical protein SFY56_04685 [Bacteroidota bacterium]|nr:hypothetical protein [Bacteroidota bacterium]